jgi:polysaccharide export outer membrane protein
MQRTKLLYTLATLACLVLIISCTSRKKFIYFQGEEQVTNEKTSFSPLLKKDDLLGILVLGLDPDAVLPFNLPPTAFFSNNTGGYSQGAPTQPGYLIDGDGNIDFPVVGKIHLEGLSRSQAVDLLKEKLGDYISKPSIIMRILNYKVTILGEVRNPGTFTIPNERITLPEALGIAGDLLITGKRNNLLVVREVDGKKTETRIDLTNKDVFKSNVYYLQQNDIVYVEPNRAKVNSSVLNPANVGLAISILSLILTMATLVNTR